MHFEWKKTENCFADSQTYEYRLPVTIQKFETYLDDWEIHENHHFRRPLMTADRNGVNIKGILDRNVIKVSFPETSWKKEKTAFENWLTGEEIENE